MSACCHQEQAQRRRPIVTVQVFLIIVALLVRIGALIVRGVIAVDGVRYLAWAHSIAHGDWAAVFNQRDFNLFPVAIGVIHTALAAVAPVSYETAALILNVVLGTALVIPVIRLTDRFFGLVPALFSGAYVALNPLLCALSTDVLREMPYLFFLLLGLDCFLGAVATAHPTRWRPAGIASASASLLVAGLFRPEGFGVLACCLTTLFVAYSRTAQPYAFAARLWRAGLMMAVAAGLAAAGIAAVHAKTGKWHFARLDTLHKGYALGTRKTTAADPLAVDKASMFRSDGTIDVDQLQRVNFMKLAKRRRWALFAAEIFDGFWRGTHGVGLIACLAGAVMLARRRVLAADDPLAVLLGLVLAGCLLVFARYVSNAYYFSARHALTVVVPCAVLFGVPMAWQSQWRPTWRLLVRVVYYIAFIILAVAAVLPRNTARVPMKTYGRALRAAAPALRTVVAPADLLLVAYYAGAEHVNLPFCPPPQLWSTPLTNAAVLVLNARVPWQAAAVTAMPASVTALSVAAPTTREYALQAFQPAVPDATDNPAAP